MTARHPEQRSDLRSRKRVAAIRHIQQVALDLFDEHGYDQVSIAQVAAAADVSERSIYRYFGAKPMLILYDVTDTASLPMFREHLKNRSLLDALAHTLDDIAPLLDDAALHEARRRLAHIDRHSQLSEATASYTRNLGSDFAAAIAAARGTSDDDLSAQVLGHAVIAALTAAIDHWHRHPMANLNDDLQAALQVLATGFAH